MIGSLGAGGMGEVYRARDARLNRDVAIKILPAPFASDADRIARFSREAQTLAALNDPHIAQIYGVEEFQDRRALVMELVDGETLADRLARGPLPLEDAVAVAHQIASALETAHDAGIIHRDLKPANIKLRADGTVKVLDFGLAKALAGAGKAGRAGGAGGDGVPNAVLDSPTMTSPAMTAAGIILGTAPYMAPEQAKGKSVDRRADIWAFGCVLFEMLTARTLFAGDSVAETLAKVIEREPDFSSLPGRTPPALRTLLTRCLQRDPKKRLRDIGEARITLEDPLAAEPLAGASSPPRVNRVAVALLILASVAITAAVTAWLIRGRGETTRPAERRFVLAAPNDAPPHQASIAPDGTALLVSAADKLWLQALDTFTVSEVPGSDGAHAPFWFGDATFFGFQARGQLWRGGRDGRAPVSIGQVPDFSFSGGAAVLPDGRVVYATGGSGLLQLSAAGGEPTPVFKLDPAKELDIHDLSALPDGRSLLYVLHTVTGNWGIELFDVTTSSRHMLYTPAEPPGANAPRYSPTGHVLYEQSTGVWALPISVRDRRATGEPFLVAPNARRPSVSADGTLLMLPGTSISSAESGLAVIDRSGRLIRTVAEPRAAHSNPRVSPDGRLAVAARGSGANTDLWIHDLQRGTERRLTFEGGANTFPNWSPDGQSIVYRCGRTICARRADGAGARVELLEPPASDPALTPDGKQLVFVREAAGSDTDIFIVELGAAGLSAKVVA